jgi:hypothetical protein
LAPRRLNFQPSKKRRLVAEHEEADSQPFPSFDPGPIQLKEIVDRLMILVNPTSREITVLIEAEEDLRFSKTPKIGTGCARMSSYSIQSGK